MWVVAYPYPVTSLRGGGTVMSSANSDAIWCIFRSSYTPDNRPVYVHLMA
jgi:hypothetical protein